MRIARADGVHHIHKPGRNHRMPPIDEQMRAVLARRDHHCVAALLGDGGARLFNRGAPGIRKRLLVVQMPYRMQRVDARRLLRAHAAYARAGRVIQLDGRMILEERDDGVAARPFHLVAAREPATEARGLDTVEPCAHEMALDARQRDHRALAARLHEAHAAAAVAIIEPRRLEPALAQLAFHEPGEDAAPHRREQLVRSTQLPQHVRRVERATAHDGARLLHHDPLA